MLQGMQNSYLDSPIMASRGLVQSGSQSGSWKDQRPWAAKDEYHIADLKKLPYHAFSSVKHIHFVLQLSLILPIQWHDYVTTSSCYIIQITHIAFTIPSRFQGLLHQAGGIMVFIRDSKTSWASPTSTGASRPSLESSASSVGSSISSAKWQHHWHQDHVGINDNFINIYHVDQPLPAMWFVDSFLCFSFRRV